MQLLRAVMAERMIIAKRGNCFVVVQRELVSGRVVHVAR